jgi:hypothetical protein
MMGFMYQAALYCDDCGRAICANLVREGKAPFPYADVAIDGSSEIEITITLHETDYDSDTFPKLAEVSGEADSVQFCASDHLCVNATDLTRHSTKGGAMALVGAETYHIGAWLENALTSEGVEALTGFIRTKDKTDYQSALANFLSDMYAQDYPEAFAEPCAGCGNASQGIDLAPAANGEGDICEDCRGFEG